MAVLRIPSFLVLEGDFNNNNEQPKAQRVGEVTLAVRVSPCTEHVIPSLGFLVLVNRGLHFSQYLKSLSRLEFLIIF